MLESFTLLDSEAQRISGNFNLVYSFCTMNYKKNVIRAVPGPREGKPDAAEGWEHLAS